MQKLAAIAPLAVLEKGPMEKPDPSKLDKQVEKNLVKVDATTVVVVVAIALLLPLLLAGFFFQ
ncbi:hypothetical protein ACQ4M4_02340 [Leptolyngbya sp. AN02str]|uniref:hypothetical protein n=1 Tax=Leptolyngbya sp. AN02str TaxID=3423363 RepID=UPI003D3146CA